MVGADDTDRGRLELKLHIVLPRENEKDLDDLPEEIRNVLEFHLVDDVDEVVRLALESAPVAAPPKVVPAEAGTVPPSDLAH